MGYEIREKDGYFAVDVRGRTSKYEILQAVRTLDLRDPGKELPDLWRIGKESMLPYKEFREIAEAIHSLCRPGMKGNRTAIVVTDPLQEAEMEMYRQEASILPYEIRVFRSEEEAVEWFRSGGS